MKITTGFAYMVDSTGKKSHKMELPLGDHPEPSNGHKIVEVPSKIHLDAVVLDKTDEQEAAEVKHEQRKKDFESARQKLSGIGLSPAELNTIFGR